MLLSIAGIVALCDFLCLVVWCTLGDSPLQKSQLQAEHLKPSMIGSLGIGTSIMDQWEGRICFGGGFQVDNDFE